MYWLMKSEPGECSIEDALAARNSTVPWTGVRNYQARNFMRDQMKPGDDGRVAARGATTDAARSLQRARAKCMQHSAPLEVPRLCRPV